MWGSLHFLLQECFFPPLRSQKAVPLPVWSDSCHNYSQVNTGRRRGWGRIERGWRGEKRRGKREPCGCLAGSVWKMETTQSGSAAACQFQVWRRRAQTRGVCARTRANWNTQEDVYCTRRDAFDKLKRRFAYSLPHLSSAVWLKRPPRVCRHCETTQTIVESPTADAVARHSASCRWPGALGPHGAVCFLTCQICLHSRCHHSPPPPSLACDWSDGGNRFELHACVFLRAGQTSLISLGDSCGKCQTRLPVTQVPICSRPSVNFWVSTHLSCTAAADRCLKSRFGSQPTDVTDDFFFVTVCYFVFVVIFLPFSLQTMSLHSMWSWEQKPSAQQMRKQCWILHDNTLIGQFFFWLLLLRGAAWISVITSRSQWIHLFLSRHCKVRHELPQMLRSEDMVVS